MKRLVFAFILVTGMEAMALHLFRTRPFSLPGYFSALLTAIQFVMCYGGIESARWLLRRSPVAHTGGPESDWARLWVWLGPPGGLLMVLSSLLAAWASQHTVRALTPAIVLAHAAGGGILWLCASLEMVRKLAGLHPRLQKQNWTLALLGLMSHLAGIWMYVKYFPAGELQVRMLFVALLLVYFVFYYIWAACLIWAVVFRFWQPAPAQPLDGLVDAPAGAAHGPRE